MKQEDVNTHRGIKSDDPEKTSYVNKMGYHRLCILNGYDELSGIYGSCTDDLTGMEVQIKWDQHEEIYREV